MLFQNMVFTNEGWLNIFLKTICNKFDFLIPIYFWKLPTFHIR